MQTGSDELVFVPLGGIGEIGMNAGLYGYGNKKNRRWILVDCCIAFAVGFCLSHCDCVFSFLVQNKLPLMRVALL